MQVAFRAGEKLKKQPEKRKILEISTCFPDTPEKGKASHYSGESLMQGWVMHPGSWKKASRPEVRC